MVYKINGIEISERLLDEYFDSLINKIFAILGVYEDCESSGNFSNYNTYLDRILTEIVGCYHIIGFDSFMSISNILSGMIYCDNMNHKKVKSLVFHCISIIKKTKNKNFGDKNELL